MPIVKRTFSIPDDVSTKLDETIPDQQRSKFVTESLAEALNRRARERLIDAIDNTEPSGPIGKSSEEIISEIRQRHAENYQRKTSADE